MNNTKFTIFTGLAVAALSLSVACGGGEEAPPAKPEAAPAAAAKKEAASDLKPWKEALSAEDILKHGESIFQAAGSNTCNDCHGKDGKKGRLEQAANLTDPSVWRSTKALDGDVAKVDAALTYLLSSGGKAFNENFAKDNPDAGFDWSKTGAEGYDIQMFGVTQSSTQAVLKKIRKSLKKEGIDLPKDDLTAFGASAVLAYVRSLSGGGNDAPAEGAAE